MKMSCNVDGKSWRSEGNRQLQLLSQEYVPSVTPAAMIAPAYQLSLNKPVITDRSLGYANSAMSCEAPLMAYTIPIPRMILATRNIATAKVSAYIAMQFQTRVRTVDSRRLQDGTNADDGGAQHHASFSSETVIHIRNERDGNDCSNGECRRHDTKQGSCWAVEVCKHVSRANAAREAICLQSSHGCTAWSPFRTLPSYPDVISTPRAAGTRQKYSRRRFFFLYHGVVSWASKCSISDTFATSVAATSWPAIAFDILAWCCER